MGGREAAWGRMSQGGGRPFTQHCPPGRAQASVGDCVLPPRVRAFRLRARGPGGSFWRDHASQVGCGMWDLVSPAVPSVLRLR